MAERLVVRGAREHNLKGVDSIYLVMLLSVSRGFLDPGSHRLLSTLFSRRDNVAMWNRFLPMHGSSLGKWISQM